MSLHLNTRLLNIVHATQQLDCRRTRTWNTHIIIWMSYKHIINDNALHGHVNLIVNMYVYVRSDDSPLIYAGELYAHSTTLYRNLHENPKVWLYKMNNSRCLCHSQLSLNRRLWGRKSHVVSKTFQYSYFLTMTQCVHIQQYILVHNS